MPKTATKDKLQQAHERLTQAVESIVSGDDWQRMLKIASKFHRYSFNNVLLIQLQKPDATLVAGFNKWKSLGRTVKRGEKGIQIFAPCRYKNRSKEPDEKALDPSAVEVAASAGRPTEDGYSLRGFKVAYIFDISQTEGEPLEDLDAVKPKLLDADAPEGIWEVLVAQANDAGFDVIRDRKGGENGFCDFVSHTIAVRPDVEGLQAVKTLVHELGHALLHKNETPSSHAVAEVEVESVAFIVLDAFGLQSDDYSFPYVTRWACGQVELVKKTAERAVKCAAQILSGCDSGS